MASNHEKLLSYSTGKEVRLGNSSLRQIPNVGSQTEQYLMAMGYNNIHNYGNRKIDSQAVA